MLDKRTKLNKLISLNKTMNKFPYGILINDKIVTEDIDWKLYRTVPLTKFQKYHVGTCYDFVNYQSYWLDQHGYDHKNIFIQIDNNYDIPTHTVSLIYLFDRVYWFESAWGMYQGIHEYPNEILAIQDIIKKHRDYSKTVSEIKPTDKTYVFEYSTKGLDNNLTATEFMKRVGNQKNITNSIVLEYTRSELPDKVFGIPEERKYPLDTEARVRSAIRFFNYVDSKYEKKLANNIIKAMKKFHITDVNVGDKNRFKKYYNQPMMESVIKSTLTKDYKPKGSKKLSEFTKKELTKDIIDAYKSKVKMLRHVDIKDDNRVVFFDKDSLVGYVCTNKENDDLIWITALEVTPNYKGYGLGLQLLDYAVKVLHASALAVSKNNNVALRMYENYGFKISDESRKEVEASNKINYLMYLNAPSFESASTLDPDFKPKSGKLSNVKESCYLEYIEPIEEACKDVETARKFVTEVGKLAKKYDANYFVVTDGASGTSNGNGGISNPAVKNARDAQIEWEKRNQFDPYEDWKKGIPSKMNTYYRITYDGIGIYEAFHQELIRRKEFSVWKNFINSNKTSWLPHPPIEYKSHYRSYFTQRGFDTFNKKAMPLMKKYLDNKKIEIRKYKYIGDTIYSDPYQIVIDFELKPITESVEDKMNDTFNEIITFNRQLNNYEYIIPNNGNIIRKISYSDWISYYKALIPLEFEKYHGGICWDYVMYEYQYFKQHFPNTKPIAYYWIAKDNHTNPTHTFLIFQYDGYTYWFESSIKKHCGIYKFRNVKDTLEYVISILEESLPNQHESYLTIYDPSDRRLIGCSHDEFINHMEKLLPSNPLSKNYRKVVPLEIIRSPIIMEVTEDITYTKLFRHVKNIVESLSKEDLHRICNGNFKKSPFVIYRDVLLYKDEPVSFIEVYKFPGMKEDGVIVLSTKEKYRNRGFSTLLIQRMKEKLNGKNLVWKTQQNNEPSISLAKQNDFNPSFEN